MVSVSLFLKRLYDPGAAFLLAGRTIQLVNSLLLSLVVVRKFGLETMGTFAIGFVGVAIFSALAQMGLPSHLPHLRAPHSNLCLSALMVEVATFPFFGLLIYAFASIEGRNVSERLTILIVALGGLLIASSNTGLMLSIMRGRFYPGLIGPLCESGGIVIGFWLPDLALSLQGFCWAAESRVRCLFGAHFGFADCRVAGSFA